MTSKTELQINNLNDFVSALNAVVEKINNHPHLQDHLVKSEDVDIAWLQASNVVNGHIEAPGDFVDLMSELLHLLDGYLIDDRGQHSEYFYKLKKYGYHVRTGERDSHGPLSAVLTPPTKKWSVCYG